MIGKSRNATLLATLIINILYASNALAIVGWVDEVTNNEISTSVVEIAGAGKRCSGVLVATDWVLSIAGCADRWSVRTNHRLRDADIRDRRAAAVFVNGETRERRLLDRVIRVDGAPFNKNSIVLFHLRRPAPEWSRPVPLYRGRFPEDARVEMFGFGGGEDQNNSRRINPGERTGGATRIDDLEWIDNGKFFVLNLGAYPARASDKDYGGPVFVEMGGQKYLVGVIWNNEPRWRCPGDAMTCSWEYPFTYAAVTFDVGRKEHVGSLIEQIIHPTATLQDGIYEIRSVHSDKCLDVPRSSSESALNIIQYSCTNAKNQQWRFTKLGDYYKISAVHSAKCLDVHSKSPWDGGMIVHNQCRDRQDSQRWWLKRVAGGAYELRPKHSARCIDVPQSSTANEVQLIQSHCTGARNQRWKLTQRDLVIKRKIKQPPKGLVPRNQHSPKLHKQNK